jgi:hypothetical protein
MNTSDIGRLILCAALMLTIAVACSRGSDGESDSLVGEYRMDPEESWRGAIDRFTKATGMAEEDVRERFDQPLPPADSVRLDLRSDHSFGYQSAGFVPEVVEHYEGTWSVDSGDLVLSSSFEIGEIREVKYKIDGDLLRPRFETWGGPRPPPHLEEEDLRPVPAMVPVLRRIERSE